MTGLVTSTRTIAGRCDVEDEDLVQAARAGDDYAGPFLVSRYAPMLLGHARAHAGDLGDVAVDEICELAVEKAIKRIALFDPAKGDFAAWARSMVRFAALDYRRSNDRLTSLEGLDTPESSPPIRQPLPAEVSEALAEAVAQLSAPDQVILALRDVEQLPSQAVAMLLGVEDAAVRQRYSRARKRLAAIAHADPRLTTFVKGGTT